MALTLISALTLPSYATVGASDGSAFVTKAEFDSALSDFNARLTTFEAGINSKIDSQVSSYLDRNGIWQGKDQIDLLKGKTYNKIWKWNWKGNSAWPATKELTWVDANDTFSKPFPYHSAIPFAAMPVLSADPEFFVNGLPQDTLINAEAKITKSGLFVIQHKFEALGPEDFAFASCGSGITGRDWCGSLLFSIKLSVDSGNCISNIVKEVSVADSDKNLISIDEYTSYPKLSGFGHYAPAATVKQYNISDLTKTATDDANKSLAIYFPNTSFNKNDVMFVKKGEHLTISLDCAPLGTWGAASFCYCLIAGGSNANSTVGQVGRCGDYSIQSMVVY